MTIRTILISLLLGVSNWAGAVNTCPGGLIAGQEINDHVQPAVGDSCVIINSLVKGRIRIEGAVLGAVVDSKAGRNIVLKDNDSALVEGSGALRNIVVILNDSAKVLKAQGVDIQVNRNTAAEVKESAASSDLRCVGNGALSVLLNTAGDDLNCSP